jgi:hypothetical protein
VSTRGEPGRARPLDLIQGYVRGPVGPLAKVAPEPREPGTPERRRTFDPGWSPALAATSALGLLVIATGDALSRSTISSRQLPFWVGLLLIYVPIAVRLVTPKPSRDECLVLVMLLGLALYAVKLFFAPFGFLFADELAHEPNAHSILQTHHLFHETSILPVTAYYPGLESVTAAVASLSGLSVFGAGVIVVGVARVIMILALFLLFERVSGSRRAAGCGVLVYAANSNFVFFDAQYAYESMALPLMLAVLFATAEWRVSQKRRDWSVLIGLLIVAIVVTHHVTSYALAGFLIALCLVYAWWRPDRLREAPIRLAVFAVVAVLVWVLTAATATIDYLWPVLRDAMRSTYQTLQGQTAPRQLFASGGYQPPILERLTGILTVLLLFGGSIIGLRVLWRKYRDDPYALVLGAGTVAFFGSLIARYAPAAWETANRASEFLFIGLAFVIGLIGFDEWFPRRSRSFAAVAVAGLFGIVFAGGVISGWTPELRLSQPYRIKVHGATVDAEGRQLARFVASAFPGARFAGSDADARLLATYARAYAIAGKSPDVYDILRSSDFALWQKQLLREQRIRYLAVDRRDRSFDNSAGYYFGLREPFGAPDSLLKISVFRKFKSLEKPYDSGNIAIYKSP